MVINLFEYFLLIKIEKVIFVWLEVTTSAEDAGDNNKFKVTFDAMIVPLPEVVVSTVKQL
jgi:hypothetical protein